MAAGNRQQAGPGALENLDHLAKLYVSYEGSESDSAKAPGLKPV